MANDGKQLEALVAFVEKTFAPQGFEVKTNVRVFTEDGVQIAEFDCEVRGQVGAKPLSWLIECRDRPSSGPAPGAWIEQLVGRKVRFGFNQVTAVSTTGFAAGAAEFAQAQGIELREVAALIPEAFGWLALRHIRQSKRSGNLTASMLLIDTTESPERGAALGAALSASDPNGAFLKAQNGTLMRPADAFSAAVQQTDLFDDVEPNGPAKKVRLHAVYPDDDYFVVDTALGPIRIRAIRFEGELTVTETLVPLTVTTEYRDSETGEMISQLAAFAPQEILGQRFAMELHHLGETGETHVTMRKVADA